MKKIEKGEVKKELEEEIGKMKEDMMEEREGELWRIEMNIFWEMMGERERILGEGSAIIREHSRGSDLFCRYQR